MATEETSDHQSFDGVPPLPSSTQDPSSHVGLLQHGHEALHSRKGSNVTFAAIGSISPELDPTTSRAIKSTSRITANALTLAQKLRSARDELVRATAKTAQLQKQCGEREREVKTIQDECEEARKEIDKLNKGLEILGKEKMKSEQALKELKDENAFLEALLKEGALGTLAGELIEKEYNALDDKIASES
ncbi:hypothetical protein M427DRAFT_280898 [Gonapodya prolifera JEL478]|uniref:Uncharacterized protein n=1 Tax=Gonapodya prolifera (strain JEL478) TaxID=1344416 RepID=A0A139AYV2_GONPJ|nr:hypothetical protein M427DRAFT_280898 [Gonapodya prolifera JEL478]|eukprot:KXS21880.1 hypothetical protein M427DRAFT_280898 [Gonapodya prolifera JEL478]